MSSPGNTAIELGGVLATARNVVFGGKFAPSAQLFKNSVCTPIKNLPNSARSAWVCVSYL